MDDSSSQSSARRASSDKVIAPRTKRLTLDLPEALHRAIKVSAAQEGVTMAEKLRAILLKHHGLDS